MKARVPREWQDLSPAQKEKVRQYLLEVLEEQEEVDARVMLDLYIKMFCVLLHDTEGFGEKRLTLLIGNMQMMFKEQARLVSQKKQLEFLDDRLKGIFRKGGFPQEFVDRLLGPADIEACHKKVFLEEI